MSDDFPGHLGGFRPGSVLAGYRLEAHVAAGGMGVVFRARDVRLGRLVALKVLAPALAADPEFRRRFIAESRAAAVVDDPHIIPVYEADEADGVLFIAMRFVAGGDLRGVLNREGPLPAARAVEFISPVASALDAAHRAGLVHRDVKPGNILVDAQAGRPDHVYLSDFGASKGAMTSVSLSGQGFLGTPDYAAPEQVNGTAVDGRADQYALACVTYRLLAGTVPFERDHGMAVLLAHLSAPPPSLAVRRPDLPGTAGLVLAKAMAKTPEQRYESCGDFADALREALGLPAYRSGRSATLPAAQPPPATSPAEIPPPEAGNGTPAALPEPAHTETIGPPGIRKVPAAATGAGLPSHSAADATGQTSPAAAAAAGTVGWFRRHRLPAIALACAIIAAAGVIPFLLTGAANTPKAGNSPSLAPAGTHSAAKQSGSASGATASIVACGDLALTGPYAQIGETDNWGAEAYFKHVNATGGILGHKVNYVTLDNQSDAAQSGLDARKCIQTYHAQVIIGPESGADTESALPIAIAGKTILVSLSSGWQTNGYPAGELNSWGFPGFYDVFAQDQIASVQNLILPRHYTRVALLEDNCGSVCLANQATVQGLAVKDGFQLVSAQIDPVGATDVTPQVLAMLAAKPQIILLGLVPGTDAITAIRAIRAQDATIPISECTSCEMPSFISAAGGPSAMQDVYLLGSVQDWLNAAKQGTSAQEKATAAGLEAYIAGMQAAGRGNQNAIDNSQAGWDVGLEIDWAITQAGSLNETAIMQRLQHLDTNTLGIVWNRNPSNYEDISQVLAAMEIINPSGSASLYK